MNMRIVFLAVLVISVVLVSGCVQEPPATDGNGGTSPNSSPVQQLSPIHVQSDRALTPKECSDRGLGDRVVFIYSSTCPACTMTKPALLEAASETGKTVEEINLVTDRDKLEDLAILPYYIPTTIIDCEIMVGAKQKFEFRDAMEMM